MIVSRGQLVEIGGSFRLPEVMQVSGAKLVDVGTTNKTHARDYERAITENTAAIMRVHPSNYKISGFTSEVPLRKLVEIAHAHGSRAIDDLGAGAIDRRLSVRVQAGADAAGFGSGWRRSDQLQRGQADRRPAGRDHPGRANWVQAVRKNPMARIVRSDKLTLAALEATLPLFLRRRHGPSREIPTLRMLARSSAARSRRAGGADRRAR